MPVRPKPIDQMKVQRGFGTVRAAEAVVGTAVARPRIRVGNYAGMPGAVLAEKDRARPPVARTLPPQCARREIAHPTAVYAELERRTQLVVHGRWKKHTMDRVSVLPKEGPRDGGVSNLNPMHCYARAASYLFEDCLGVSLESMSIGGFIRVDGRIYELGHDLLNYFCKTSSDALINATLKGFVPPSQAFHDFLKYRYRVYCAEHLLRPDERVLLRLDELIKPARDFYLSEFPGLRDPDEDGFKGKVSHNQFAADAVLEERIAETLAIPKLSDIALMESEEIYSHYFSCLDVIDAFLANRGSYTSCLATISQELRSRARDASRLGAKYVALHFTVMLNLNTLLEHLESYPKVGSGTRQFLAPHVPFTRLDVVMLSKLVQRLTIDHDLMMARVALGTIPTEERPDCGALLLKILQGQSLSELSIEDEVLPATFEQVFEQQEVPESFKRAIRALAGAHPKTGAGGHPIEVRQLTYLMLGLLGPVVGVESFDRQMDDAADSRLPA